MELLRYLMRPPKEGRNDSPVDPLNSHSLETYSFVSLQD